MNDQPMSTASDTASGATGTTGRSGLALPTIQAAPTPASSPATASGISLAFASRRTTVTQAA